MRLNEAGEMVLQVWNELPVHYRHIELDEFVIMPNHVHGIVMLNDVGAGPSACPVANEKTHPLSKDRQPPSMDGQPRGVAPTRLSLSDIVHRFKSFTTAQYRRGVSQFHCLPFKGKLWQRNYYEHIIRNEIELKKIREYIVNNPLNCMEDENYINL